jgi:hypothetical protein
MPACSGGRWRGLPSSKGAPGHGVAREGAHGLRDAEAEAVLAQRRVRRGGSAAGRAGCGGALVGGEEEAVEIRLITLTKAKAKARTG